MSLTKDPFQKYIAEVALEDPLQLQVAKVGLFTWIDYIIFAEETIILQKGMEKLQNILQRNSKTRQGQLESPEIEMFHTQEIQELNTMFQEHFSSFSKMPYITNNEKLLHYFGSYVKANLI